MHALAILILILTLSACRPAETSASAIEPPNVLPASVQELTPYQALKLMQSTPNMVILDAREEWEIKQNGRIAGSLHVDYLNGRRFTENTAKLDPKQPALIYCALGERSRLGAAILAKKGFTQLSVLSGGFEAWLTQGKPVQK